MHDLEQLLASCLPPSGPQEPGDSPSPLPVQAPAQVRERRSNYTHDALIDMIIARPELKQNDYARHFGYTASWISTVMSSDDFKAKLAARRAELVDPTLMAGIQARFEGIALRAMEVLSEKLDRPVADIPDNLALRALELSSRAAGYGAKIPAPVEINFNTHLEAMGDNLTQLLRRRKALEGDFHEVEETPAGPQRALTDASDPELPRKSA